MWLIGKRPWERLREGTSHVAHKEKDHGKGLKREHPMWLTRKKTMGKA